VINGKTNSLTIKRHSDYVNSESLVRGLNQILIDLGYKGNKFFTDLTGGAVFDFGIGFVTKQQEDKLVENGIVYK